MDVDGSDDFPFQFGDFWFLAVHFPGWLMGSLDCVLRCPQYLGSIMPCLK